MPLDRLFFFIAFLAYAGGFWVRGYSEQLPERS